MKNSFKTQCSTDKPAAKETTLKYQRGVLCLHKTTFHGFVSAVCNVCAAAFTYPDDENPFDEGEAKARDGPVAASRRGGQTERQEEANPVEQEGHWTKTNIRNRFRKDSVGKKRKSALEREKKDQIG